MVSIIMPVKNAALFLDACIESIVKQDYTHWELISVDDHSTDDSYSILEKFAKHDARIHLIRNSGDGIIEALQEGYALSKGNMIHRMDADDLMPPEKLKLLSQQLEEAGKGNVATGLVEYFSADGVSEGYQKYEQWLNTLCKEANHWSSIYKECVIASPAWMLYREDFEACGGFNSTIYPEDYDLVFRFYKAGYQVCSVLETVHLWRDHSKRTSRNHPNYQENAFFKLKLQYFFKLDREVARPLVVWGAGPKGKAMVRLLQEKNEIFVWASNNANKHGHDIYGQIMQSIDQIMQLRNPQILITVAQRSAQEEIRDHLDAYGLKTYEDYFFFR
ncbi:MAG: glycosyltransferase involved in cell wall biosynthesis [Marivirga sp.]|jgi:glycosyltransferase involved in cell wall biosynthesis